MTSNFLDVEQLFVNRLLEKGIQLSESQLQQFRAYYDLLIDWNSRMNLTNITDHLGVYFKHFFDSISLSFTHRLEHVTTFLDIGPGAGFPSIPLKICFPHLQITMVETLNKRVTFLNHVIQQLDLSFIQAKHARIEDLGQDEEFRYHFDLVTARAVSRLSTLLEVSMPFLNEKGFFISLKGPDIQDEMLLCQRAMVLLKAECSEQFVFDLPNELGKRTVLKFKRNGLIPNKYPRKQGQPFHSPL
jgi:16S rRNA (guanine527-N7)-methyltransferase